MFLWLSEEIDFVFCSESAPDIDESNDNNRDPELKDSYKGLVNIRISVNCDFTDDLVYLFVLRAACIISWSNKKGPGLPCYTGILIEIPKINNE